MMAKKKCDCLSNFWKNFAFLKLRGLFSLSSLLLLQFRFMYSLQYGRIICIATSWYLLRIYILTPYYAKRDAVWQPSVLLPSNLPDDLWCDGSCFFQMKKIFEVIDFQAIEWRIAVLKSFFFFICHRLVQRTEDQDGFT